MDCSKCNERRTVEGRDGTMVDIDSEKVVNAVRQIRCNFLEEYAANPHLYIARDIELIKNNDYFIRRFLYPHDLDASTAYEQFRTWMAWRKEVGLQKACDERFPKEFFQIGALFPCKLNTNDNVALELSFLLLSITFINA